MTKLATPLEQKVGYVECGHINCFQIIIGKQGDLCDDCKLEDPDHDTDSCGLCDNDSDV